MATKTVPLPIRWRRAVTEHEDVNAQEWAVAMALSTFMDNRSGQCHPGKGTLQRVTRLSRSSVKRALNGLESKSLLGRRRRRVAADWNDSNIYTALFPMGDRSPQDLGGSPGVSDLGRRGTPVSSETQGDGRSALKGSPKAIKPSEAESPLQQQCPACLERYATKTLAGTKEHWQCECGWATTVDLKQYG